MEEEELETGGGADHGAETLATGVPPEAEAGMPQLDPSFYPNLVFWLILAIGALYFILSRVALPRIGETMAERNDVITGDIEQAATLKRRAEEAEATYNKALAEAKAEAQRIGAEAKAQIQDELRRLTAEADAEIAAKSAESEKRIGEIRDSAARSVEEVSRGVALDIVGALMPSAADADAANEAVTGRLRS